jgi:hypothetical protein
LPNEGQTIIILLHILIVFFPFKKNSWTESKSVYVRACHRYLQHYNFPETNSFTLSDGANLARWWRPFDFVTVRLVFMVLWGNGVTTNSGSLVLVIVGRWTITGNSRDPSSLVPKVWVYECISYSPSKRADKFSLFRFWMLWNYKTLLKAPVFRAVITGTPHWGAIWFLGRGFQLENFSMVNNLYNEKKPPLKVIKTINYFISNFLQWYYLTIYEYLICY